MRSGRRVLVTRPADQAHDWAARLCDQGFDAVALPLIGIGPVADPQPVIDAWRAIGARDALMFVSANAVLQFFAARPSGSAWPPQLLAAAPGPGTASALRDAGVPAAAILEPDARAARFDSESLWEALAARDWRGRKLLILRGGADDGEAGQGREWLAERWREAGAQVESLAVYRRSAPTFDATQSAHWQAALDRPHQHLWLFSSSEAVDRGEARARAEQRTSAWRAAPALATHPRIAEHARALGFATVVEAKAGFAEVVAALKAAASAGPTVGPSINCEPP